MYYLNGGMVAVGQGLIQDLPTIVLDVVQIGTLVRREAADAVPVHVVIVKSLRQFLTTCGKQQTKSLKFYINDKFERLIQCFNSPDSWKIQTVLRVCK